MRSIRIERYGFTHPGSGFSGLIEGVTDDDRSWIVYLDDVGRPALYWPERDESGAVIGEPISLMNYVPSESGPEVPDIV